MKKLLHIFIFLTLVVLFVAPIVVSAQNTYHSLSPLPGVPDERSGSFVEYINDIIQVGTGIAIVLAVLFIVIGGIQYMTSEAIGGKSQGKERIKQALAGLLLIFSIFIILNTINPAITSLDSIREVFIKVNPDHFAEGGLSGGQWCFTIPFPGSTNRVAPACHEKHNECVESREEEESDVSCSFYTGSYCYSSGSETSCEPSWKECVIKTKVSEACFPERWGSCEDCEKVAVSHKPPGEGCDGAVAECKVTTSLNEELKSLQYATSHEDPRVSWWVTEAWPPTVKHQHSCHTEGWCVDANLRGTDAGNPASIEIFINKAQSIGLRAVYEVTSEERRREIVDQIDENLDSRIQYIPGIKHEHFSVYGQKPEF